MPRSISAQADAAAGTAEALYNAATGELFFDIGEGIGVVGIGSAVMHHGAVNNGSIFGTPVQNGGGTLAFFSAGSLPTGEDSIGLVLPAGLTQGDINFSYTPVGSPTVNVPVFMIPIPEPSTLALLGVLGAIGLCWRRRRA